VPVFELIYHIPYKPPPNTAPVLILPRTKFTIDLKDFLGNETHQSDELPKEVFYTLPEPVDSS
jgi:hypothetical protein